MSSHDDAHKSDTYKSMIDISRDSFKFLATLNGGTWLSVLLFTSKEATRVSTGAIKCGVAFFIWSMVLTAVCFLGSWSVQYCLHNENYGRFKAGVHMRSVVFTCVVYVAAIACYARGAWLSMQGVLI